jgi:hypothetical protein
VHPFPALADYLATMRATGETTILTYFGNDDFHLLEPFLNMRCCALGRVLHSAADERVTAHEVHKSFASRFMHRAKP